MLSLSHVSVKTSTQQLLTVRFADLSSRMWSILLSKDRTLAMMMEGMAGRVGLAAIIMYFILIFYLILSSPPLLLSLMPLLPFLFMTSISADGSPLLAEFLLRVSSFGVFPCPSCLGACLRGFRLCSVKRLETLSSVVISAI